MFRFPTFRNNIIVSKHNETIKIIKKNTQNTILQEIKEYTNIIYYKTYIRNFRNIINESIFVISIKLILIIHHDNI